MKPSIPLALFSLTVLLAPLSAERETYVAASGYWVDNNTDGAPGGALRVGWHFPSDAKYRISTDVEVEASYWEIDNVVDYRVGEGRAETKNLPVLANIRVNVPLADTGLFIYGGGGAGVAYLTVKGNAPGGGRLDDSAAVFTYGFFAGIGGRVTDRVEVRLGYRALWLGDEDFNDVNVDAKMDTERNDLFEVALRVGL